MPENMHHHPHTLKKGKAMSTEASRIQEMKYAIQEYLDNAASESGERYTLSKQSMQHVAEQLTWAHERNFDNPDTLTDEEFIEDIEQAWNERIIDEHLIPPTEEYVQHFTEAEHGIDATLTVWAKGTNITSENNNAGYYDQDEPGNPLRLSYVDGAFIASIISAVVPVTVVIGTNFVDTQDDVQCDGDFSAMIEVHREKRDDDPDTVEIIDEEENVGSTDPRTSVGEIPIIYED